MLQVSEAPEHKLLITASLYINSGEYAAAELLCDEAIVRNESMAVALTCKAQSYAGRNLHDKAIDLYNEALSHWCNDSAVIRYYLALSLFSIGKQREGWCNLHRSITECDTEIFKPLYVSRKRFTKPMFMLQMPPAVVHVHADAGYGDNILMLRYLPLLVEKGYAVRYEAKPEMVKFAQDSFPDIEVVPLIDGREEDFDYHTPITDLPYQLETDIDTIPWSGPYIRTDPALVEKYKLHKGKIGIVWATGGFTNGQFYVSNKSISFNLLKPIIDIDPSLFVSLQTGPERLKNNRIIDPIPKNERLLTWAETAALVENLDLVISVDTGVAHLAGAMGKPTWLMMHKHLTSFQFMSEYNDAFWNTASPWYPSMKIFRQREKGDWNSVVENIVVDLQRYHVRLI